MRLWITLAVTTLMVALTAYVLSFALLGPGKPAAAPVGCRDAALPVVSWRACQSARRST